MSIAARGFGQTGIGAIVAGGYAVDAGKLAQAYAFAVQVCVDSLVLTDEVRAFLLDVGARTEATMAIMVESFPPLPGVEALPPLDEDPTA